MVNEHTEINSIHQQKTSGDGIQKNNLHVSSEATDVLAEDKKEGDLRSGSTPTIGEESYTNQENNVNQVKDVNKDLTNKETDNESDNPISFIEKHLSKEEISQIEPSGLQQIAEHINGKNDSVASVELEKIRQLVTSTDENDKIDEATIKNLLNKDIKDKQKEFSEPGNTELIGKNNLGEGVDEEVEQAMIEEAKRSAEEYYKSLQADQQTDESTPPQKANDSGAENKQGERGGTESTIKENESNDTQKEEPKPFYKNTIEKIKQPFKWIGKKLGELFGKKKSN